MNLTFVNGTRGAGLLVFVSASFWTPTLAATMIKDHQQWCMAEFTYTRYIGNRTTAKRPVQFAEMRPGWQMNIPGYRNLSIGMGRHLLFNDAGDGDGNWIVYLTWRVASLW